jgi:hypothetical protein
LDAHKKDCDLNVLFRCTLLLFLSPLRQYWDPCELCRYHFSYSYWRAHVQDFDVFKSELGGKHVAAINTTTSHSSAISTATLSTSTIG